MIRKQAGNHSLKMKAYNVEVRWKKFRLVVYSATYYK